MSGGVGAFDLSFQDFRSWWFSLTSELPEITEGQKLGGVWHSEFGV